MSAPRKLLIVANGLRDHVGHYFETSVSVAEAARRAGWMPVLGTHVECRIDLLPGWLPSCPLFRTDYWMRPLEDGLPRPSSNVNDSQTAREVRPPHVRVAQSRVNLAKLAKLAARYSMPPLAYDIARVFSYCCLPRIVRRPHRGRLRSALSKVSRRWQYGGDAALIEQAARFSEITACVNQPGAQTRMLDALRTLAPLGALAELEYSLMFKQDLQKFLALSGAGGDDQVLLTTAHARESLAVHFVAEQLGHADAPTFHLEFRHPLFEGEATADELERSPTVAVQRALLSLPAQWGIFDRIKFYTDSERLARDYESICGLRFGVLPLPFRAELIGPPAQRPHKPLTVAYVGEARDEKGFHWLPGLIEELQTDYLLPGRVKFLVQANVSCPEHNPRSVEALAHLQLRKDEVELAALTEALSPADYYRLVARADVMLLPYLQSRYRASTSGVLAEALAAGIPAIVPDRTWLADQLPPGGGEGFHDFPSFVIAVKRVIDDYDVYRAAVSANRTAWLAKHTPDALLRTISGSGEPLLAPYGRTAA